MEPSDHLPKSEAPEVRDALAKAQKFAALSESAKDAQKRDYYDRMSRKWFGIANGWRVIAGIDEKQ